MSRVVTLVLAAASGCLTSPGDIGGLGTDDTEVTAAESRAEHDEAGELPLVLSGLAVTTDPRASAGSQLRVVVDPPVAEQAIDPAFVALTRSTGELVAAEDIELALATDGTELTIGFPGLADQRLPDQGRYGIDLAGLGFGGETSFELRLLAGDVDGDGTVAVADSDEVLAALAGGAPPVAARPDLDVNADGAIDPLDVGFISARLGFTAP